MIYYFFNNFFTCRFQIQVHELSSTVLVLTKYYWELCRVQLLQIVWDCSDHFSQHEKLLHICNLHWILLLKEKKKKKGISNCKLNTSLKTWKLFIFNYSAFNANQQQVAATDLFRMRASTFSYLLHTFLLWAETHNKSSAFPKIAINMVLWGT